MVRIHPELLLARTCLALLGAVAGTAFPSPAAAAVVHTAAHCCDDPPSDQALYVAAPGEVNRVTVRVVPSGDEKNVRFHDAGAALTAGAGCLQVGPHAARCASVDAARLHLGDGDDTLAVKESRVFQYYFPLTAYGGDGADTLRGAINWDFLRGGRGSDTVIGGGGGDDLSGGPGSDRVDGGPGDDAVTGDSLHPTRRNGDDEIDGGAGQDVVVYSGGARPVHVDLKRGTGGAAPGDSDRLVGIEDASLDAGTGVLAGDDRANELDVDRHAGPAVLRGRGGDDDLQGGEAPDSIYGGSGDDFLAGGGIGDRFRAGPGDDEILPHRLPGDGGRHDGWAASIRCGSGHDHVIYLHRHDLLPPDCDEATSEARLGIRPRLRLVGEDEVELSLRRRGPHISCRYGIRLRAPFPQSANARPRLIGSVVFHEQRKTWRRIRIRLNDYGRRLAARPGRLPVWVQAGESDRCARGYDIYFDPAGFTALL